jgi:hypothetical protein
MRLAIYEILQNASKLTKKEEKIQYLRNNYNPVLGNILKYTFDNQFIWDLPPGDPPYKPCEYPDSHGMLYTEARKLYLFLRGGNPNLTPFKRETLFINLLETVHPEDAKLLLSVKDKKLPYKGLTLNLIKEAYPGLIDEQERVQEV